MESQNNPNVNEDYLIMGNNVWNENEEELIKLQIRTNKDVEFELGVNTDIIFDPSWDYNLMKVLLVYEFYNSCRKITRRRIYKDLDVKDLHKVDFSITQLMCGFNVVKYFGSAFTKDICYKYGHLMPNFALYNINRALDLKVTLDPNHPILDLVYAAADNSPFPTIMNIT